MQIKKPHDLLEDRAKAIADVTKELSSIDADWLRDDVELAERVVDIVDRHMALPARKLLEAAVDGYYDHANQIGVPDSWYMDSQPYLGFSISTSFFACPTCEAEPGMPCMQQRGTRAKKNHSARKQAADEYLRILRMYVLRDDEVDISYD